jgi:two-component system cell cycle sensor histidine kinase/response regulator CckA
LGLYNLSPHSVNKILEEALRDFRLYLPSNVELFSSITSESLTVNCDEQALKAVFREILTNARESIPERGEISVRCFSEYQEFPEKCNPKSAPGWFVVTEIKDNGEGIGADYRHRIFEPFYTTKEERNALGLGLSIAYGIVEGLGGWIELDSIPNAGTTVLVYLPRVAEGGIQKPTPENTDAEHSREGSAILRPRGGRGSPFF